MSNSTAGREILRRTRNHPHLTVSTSVFLLSQMQMAMNMPTSASPVIRAGGKQHAVLLEQFVIARRRGGLVCQ